MSLRFVADHCISRSIIQLLKEEGYTVFWLKDHIPTDPPDEVKNKGIISLQVRNHPEVIPSLLTVLKRYLGKHPDMELYKGKLFKSCTMTKMDMS